MKKIVVAAATVVAAMAVVVGSAGGSGGPLAVNSGFVCNVLDSDGTIVQTTNSIAYWYASGSTYLRCERPGTATGQRVQFTFENTGLLCNTTFDITDEWKNTIGRNGQIQLTCTGNVNPGDNFDSASGAGVG